MIASVLFLNMKEMKSANRLAMPDSKRLRSLLWVCDCNRMQSIMHIGHKPLREISKIGITLSDFLHIKTHFVILWNDFSRWMNGVSNKKVTAENCVNSFLQYHIVQVLAFCEFMPLSAVVLIILGVKMDWEFMNPQVWIDLLSPY